MHCILFCLFLSMLLSRFKVFVMIFEVITVNINSFSSVTQSCPTLCDPMDCSTPCFPVLPHLLQFVPTHVHRVSSVQSLSCVRLFVTPWIAAHQASLSITISRSLPRLMSIESWCHPDISSSVVPFSSCSQSLPASESFPMSQLFTWGGQSTGASALASVLPMNTQSWSPLGLSGWISLQSKWLSRVFSNTTVQKHQFFSAQLSSQSNCHVHTWPLEKP